jgi:hypothetical protein
MVVKKAGAPETYLLWLPPKQDSVFQRAVREDRILTVHQENVGTKKDYGMVGFREEPNAQFLVFPKSLKTFADRRIIGINYDLLAKDSRAGAPSAKERPKAAEKAAKKEELKPAAQKTDTAVLRGRGKNVVAFEPAVERPAAVPSQQDESPEASTLSATRRSTKKPKPLREPNPVNPPKGTDVPEPAPPAKPAKEPATKKEPPTDRVIDERVLSVVRRAMKDLDAGKTVAAYKRLEALIAEANGRGG